MGVSLCLFVRHPTFRSLMQHYRNSVQGELCMSFVFTNVSYGFCSVLENYAKWQLVLRYLPYLSEDFSNAYSAFTLATTGKQCWMLVFNF